MRLAHLYESGPPEFRDPMQARELHRQACHAGEGVACYELAEHIVKSRPQDAAELYVQGCGAEHWASCAGLAQLHLSGAIDGASPVRARALLDQACAGGYKAACTTP
ncbi:MAG: hypothetical protein H6739_25965 [Alphaproteobacteria bacterium]|nr:hypothetical protein [Alphaproteobacteria bacterium]